MPTNWIDVTRPIFSGMPVWPGDPPVSEDPVSRIANGDSSNVTLYTLGSHTGTHVDAPWHFEPDGATVDSLSPDVLCGDCLVVHLTDSKPQISAADLAAFVALPASRLLVRTVNSEVDSGAFHEDFVALSADAAAWIVAHDIRLVGVDGPSVEEFASTGYPVHHTLLGAGVVIVEGLDLTGVGPGRYGMVCAPLKWSHGDGAPARVWLYEIEN